MEKTIMTLKEAQEFVKNTRYIVFTEDESKQLQEKLFEIGCEWYITGKIVCNKEHPFLFVDYNLRITFIEEEFYEHFEKSEKLYRPIDSIIRIEIEQPKTKFDPSTLQPFDKVLVRDDDDDDWKCNLFSHVEKGTEACVFSCVSHYWKKCIPYNDETKHLVGTEDEAPEFYRL